MFQSVVAAFAFLLGEAVNPLLPSLTIMGTVCSTFAGASYAKELSGQGQGFRGTAAMMLFVPIYTTPFAPHRSEPCVAPWT